MILCQARSAGSLVLIAQKGMRQTRPGGVVVREMEELNEAAET